MRKIMAYGTLAGCLLLLAAAGPAVCRGQAAESGKVFPLPSSEAEAWITRALEQQGFAVHRSPLAMGMTAITAKRNDGSLRFILAPRSALATQVQASGTAGGRGGEAFLGDILGSAAGEAHGPKEPGEAPFGAATPGGARNQAIPNPILARIESVVCITAVLEERTVQFSGLVVERDGLILCTAHDLTNIRAMTVGFYDGSRRKGRIVKMDRRRDLVLLQVPVRLDAFIPLTGGRNLVGMGERLYTVGCPENLNGTVSSGFVNGPPRRVRGLPLWQVNMEILPGSSGSPVFDVEGNLIGVVKGRLRGTDSVGFLIPVETIIDFLKER
jgi:serine protease Do